MSDERPTDEVVIRVRDNGSLKISGPVTIVDAEGNPFTLPAGSGIALCRCCRSTTKPFCDSSHRHHGFRSAPRADGTEAEVEPRHG